MSKTLKVYLRSVKEYKLWREHILVDSGKKCVISGSIVKLEIHHLDTNFASFLGDVLKMFPNILANSLITAIPLKDLERLHNIFFDRHRLLKGVPMTKKLHKLFHQQYGKYGNTREQVKQFKADYLTSRSVRSRLLPSDLPD